MISSGSNQHIKRIRSLLQRKAREDAGVFFVEGIRLVAEAVQLQAPIETLIVAPDLLSSPFAKGIVEQARQANIPTLEVTSAVFETFSLKEGPQGLAAIVLQKWEPLERVVPGNELGWVALEEVRNPGNLGAILRTCDAVGCSGVLLLGSTTDPYDPAAVRASMGAIFSQRLIRTTIETLIQWKQRYNLTVMGASDSAPTDYQAVSYTGPVVLFLGAEQQGLSAPGRGVCDTVVRIPMIGRSDSLNLAVATGVLLYEVFNQHRNRKM